MHQVCTSRSAGAKLIAMRSEAREQNRVSRPRRELIVERLLGAVEGMLHEEGVGYPDISVGTLAEQAGISRSTFYLYFPGKVELLGELSADVINQVTARAAALWDLPRDADCSAVRDAILRLIETYYQHRTLLAAVIDTSASEPALREHYYGMIIPELDPQGTAPWLAWMIERGLHQLLGRTGEPDLHDLADNVTAIIWRLFYAGLRSP